MTAANEQAQVAELVARARKAQAVLAGYSQSQVDEVVIAAAWAIINPENNERLSKLAVEETGLGNHDRAADGLPRRHIRHRPNHHPFTGNAGAVQHRRHAEVTYLGASIFSQQHVARL